MPQAQLLRVIRGIRGHLMGKLETFTSMGNKILRHGTLLADWNNGVPKPQSLQIALTEKCSLRCKFCSVVNREKTQEIPYNDLIAATTKFIDLGIKTVEITGGGDPLLYPRLNEYLSFLLDKGIKVGVITNGIQINKKIHKYAMERLSWIRISSNVLDYRDEIEIPKNFKGTLGFSYCWTDGLSTEEQLLKIKDIALKNDVKYIRMVPNCLSTKEELQKQHDFLTPLVEKVGEPFFYQQKEFGTPDNCYWGYLKPFLYCDGYVYPCSSTVLNANADKQFNPAYRWYHWKDITKTYETNITSAVDTKVCTHCVFVEQNELLEYALTEQSHENFI